MPELDLLGNYTGGYDEPDPVLPPEFRDEIGMPSPEPAPAALRNRFDPEGRGPRDGLPLGESLRGQARSGGPIGALIESTDLAAVGREPDDAALEQPQGVSTVFGVPVGGRRVTREEMERFRAGKEANFWEQLAFDLSKSSFTPTSVGAAVGATITDPTNLIGLPARATLAIGRGIASIAPHAGPAITRALTSGVEVAAINTATDPTVQGIRLTSGAQEHYEPAQTALAPVVGFAAGGALGAAAHGVGRTVDGAGRPVSAAEPPLRPEGAPEPQNSAVASEAGTAAPEPRSAEAPAGEVAANPIGKPPGWAWRPSALVARLREVVDSALGAEPKRIIADLGEVSHPEVMAAARDAGVDVTGYHHTIDNYAIRHTLAQHGSEATEIPRGQIPVTLEDFDRVPEIIATPDAVRPGGKTAAGRDAIVYEKRFGDTVFYVEEVRTKRGELAMQTMYKRRGEPGGSPRPDEPGGSPEPSSGTDGSTPGSEDNIAPSGGGGEPASAVAQASGDAARTITKTPRESLPTFTGGDLPASPNGPAGIFLFDAGKLEADANRFQFKGNGDAEGVTHALKGVTKWDPAKANQLIVWEQADGTLFVADGHQRSGLARRLIADGHEKNIRIPGILYREADGFSAEFVRAIAAAKNIAEGSGSPIDGAKVLRDRPELLDGSMPISRTEARQAFELARLSDDAFRMVTNEVVPYQHAAVVGRLIPNDGARQVAALEALARFKPRNEVEATVLVQRVAQAELAKREAGAQGAMFGDLIGAESTAGEEMRIVAKAIQELKKDKALFSRVVSNADRIEAAGSQIERGSAKAVAADADLFAKLIASDAYSSGPLRDALTAAAKELKNGGQSLAQAVKGVLNAVQREAENGVLGRVRDSGGGGRSEGAPLATERGADGLPQILIPGVEPVSDKQLDLEGSKPLKGSHKPASEGGLFDEAARAQKDLLDPPDVQAMAARRNTAPNARDPDRPFAVRRELPGEAEKARALPADATPDEIHAFRVTDAIRDVAGLLGRKVEVDGRFTARSAIGEYKLKDGVIRLRHEGDFETFAHEAGHAIDHRLVTGPSAADWLALRDRFTDELKPLDANAAEPGARTVAEGVAEFLRSYVTNPAYARREAPGFAGAFDRFIEAHAPELRTVLNRAARASQIDSGMAPVDAIRSMIVSAVEPRGFAKFKAEWSDLGLPRTLGLWFDRFYAAAVGKDHWADRFVGELKEARYAKTGQPMPEFGWQDPYKMHRSLVAARQTGMDAIYRGIRAYGAPMDAPVSPPLYDALSTALGGRVDRLHDAGDPLVSDFTAYLVARRSRALYERYEAGEIRNPPVRRSRAEVLRAIADLEAQHPTFAEAADGVFAFANAVWDKKHAAGLIPTEVHQAVAGRGDDYVPFFRDMRDERPASGVGPGIGEKGLAGKRFKGSTRDILNPLETLIFDVAKTERLIALNDTVKALHALAKSGGEFAGRLLERIPNTDLKGQSVDLVEAIRSAARERGVDKADAETIIRSLEELIGDDTSASVFRAQATTLRGERVLFYWDGGERVALKVGQDEVSRQFFDLLSGFTPSERDVFFALAGKANALFSQLITNAPQFALKNLVMDNLSRLFIARHTGVAGRLPFASLAQGVYTHIFDREFTRAYAAMGGIRGGVVSAAAREVDEARGIGAIALPGKGLATVVSPSKALGAIIQVIEAAETTGRLGQGKLVFRHLKKQGLSDVEAMQGAAFEARDILDYDRRGGAMGGFTRLMPFLNAGIQGTDRALRNLMGDPLKAAIQAYRRGGYDKLDDSMKTALADAVVNWGFLSAAMVATLGYHAMVQDSPIYQRRSDYMRKRYFIVPIREGMNAEDDVFLSIPKPFDLPGALLSAVEAAADGIRRADPKGWERVGGALLEGFAPRQFHGLNELLSANPLIKTGAEYATGQRLGFEGSKATPIVPQGLKDLPPEMQYTGTTSLVAKKLGEWFGASPVVADHVMNGLGATLVRDGNALITGLFDDNPNMTAKDAATRLFFGGLYRRGQGVGEPRNVIAEAMGQDGGRYIVAANGYWRRIEDGDRVNAEAIYNRADENGKATILLRGSAHFTPAERQLNPLERAEAVAEVTSRITRDLALSRVEVLDRSRKRGDAREYIQVNAQTARALTNTVQALAAEEIRNGLSVAGVEGYKLFDVIDTADRYRAIRALSPEVAAEFEKQLEKKHILPLDAVRQAWPAAKGRLLRDRETADLSDLVPPEAKKKRKR